MYARTLLILAIAFISAKALPVEPAEPAVEVFLNDWEGAAEAGHVHQASARDPPAEPAEPAEPAAEVFLNDWEGAAEADRPVPQGVGVVEVMF